MKDCKVSMATHLPSRLFWPGIGSIWAGVGNGGGIGTEEGWWALRWLLGRRVGAKKQYQFTGFA